MHKFKAIATALAIFLPLIIVWMYMSTQTVDVDLIWQNANQGDVHAQYKLGEMYRSGEGVRQDEREAVKWLRMAADHGVAEAQHSLGGIYENDAGGPQDNREAYIWFSLAATNGVELATQSRDDLATRLSPADLRIAQAEAKRRLKAIDARHTVGQ